MAAYNSSNDINAEDVYGRPALQLCLLQNPMLSFRLILAGTRQPSYRRSFVNMVVDALARGCIRFQALHVKIVQELLRASGGLETEPLGASLAPCHKLLCAHSDALPMCLDLLRRSNSKTGDAERGWAGRLLSAAVRGTSCSEGAGRFLAELVVSPGVDLDQPDSFGDPPLFATREVWMARLLLDRNASLQLTNRAGQNALDVHLLRLAQRPSRGQADLVSLLFSTGLRRLSAPELLSAYLVESPDRGDLDLNRHLKAVVDLVAERGSAPLLRRLKLVPIEWRTAPASLLVFEPLFAESCGICEIFAEEKSASADSLRHPTPPLRLLAWSAAEEEAEGLSVTAGPQPALVFCLALQPGAAAYVAVTNASRNGVVSVSARCHS